MNLLDALANWATGFVSAAVIAALSLGSPAVPAVSPGIAGNTGMLGWAQSVDDGSIQQVGEATQAGDEDAEALDAGAPPVESNPSSSSDAVVDQTGDDVELLDQGEPSQETTSTTTTTMSTETNVVESVAPATAAESAAPVASGDIATTATAVDMGPQLPAGFGEGQVLVSTAAGDFPPGIDECHVGAVTGRAYVGIDCDEEGTSFVGHAPTFEDFPFVTDENFPFDNNDPIVADENFPFGGDDSTPTIAMNSGAGEGSNVLVAAGGRREGPSVSLPEGSEGAVIERAQRSSGEATVERSDKNGQRNRSTSVSVDASSGNSSDRVQSASKDSNKSSKESSGNSGKAKHKQKAKNEGKGKSKNKNANKSKKANKSSKSHDKGKKAKKADKGSKKNR